MNIRKIVVLLLVICLVSGFYGQSSYSGFYLEGVSSNLVDSSVVFRSQLYNAAGVLLYEENQTKLIDSTGKWWVTIGQGTYNAGVYSTIDSIPFGMDTISLRVEMNWNGAWVTVADSKLSFVPYAFHSRKSAQSLSLIEIIDTTTPGVNLVYDTTWHLGSPIADYAFSSGTAVLSDTADYIRYPIIPITDSAQYVLYVDSTFYSNLAGNVDSTSNAFMSDSTLIAMAAGWQLVGVRDVATPVLGTTNNVPLSFRTNGQEWLSIDSSRIVFSSSQDTSVSDLAFKDLSFAYNGNLGSNLYPTYGGRLHFAWLSDESALRTGIAEDSVFSPGMVGYTSSVFGTRNYCKAKGALVIGDSCAIDSIGEYSFVVGKGHYVNQRYSLLSGKNCYSNYERNIAMGDRCSTPLGFSCVAMGTNVVSHGANFPTFSFGQNIINDGQVNTVMGYKVMTQGRWGAFVYADRSTEDTLKLNMGRSFVIRAAGGIGIYSTSDLSVGVYLFPGSGSWSSTSSLHAKRHIKASASVVSLIDRLRLYRWRYENSEAVHLGPMAQDLYSLYNYGESNTMINSVDIDGLVMKGIKELDEKLGEMRCFVKADVNDVTFDDIQERLEKLLMEYEK